MAVTVLQGNKTMVKKKTNDHLSLGFSHWDTNDYIRECPNVVRWNARLAIKWMESITSRVWSPTQIRAYNQAAQDINTYLDNLETYRFYDKYAVWENDRIQRLTLLETYD